MPSTAVSAIPGTVSLDIPSIEGVLNGGITFDHFGPEGGIYIACAPGNGEGYTESFESMPAAMPVLLNESGLEIVLESPSTKIGAGAPISYNNVDVGEVIAKTLSQDGKKIFLNVRIREEYARLARTNSFFWPDTTVEAKVGFFKVEVDRPTVIAPHGRIAFLTPDSGGAAVRKGKVFSLLSEQPRNLLPEFMGNKNETPKPPAFRKR